MTLHLSGNGFSGTLGEIFSTNDSHPLAKLNESQPFTTLVDLNLANNRLEGTIPESLQRHGQFLQLDLSCNRLSGTLLGSFAVLNSSHQKVDLSVNRLSGNIPLALMQAPAGVNILEGNLFECSQSQMPDSDPD